MKRNLFGGRVRSIMNQAVSMVRPRMRDAKKRTTSAPVLMDYLENRSFLSAFTLHSNPGASKVIYLDFDGHTVTGTQWNTEANPDVTNIVTNRYDTDSDTGSFSANELSDIEAIFASVKEDFIPFDVDVTTEEPAAGGLTRTSGGTDTTWGVRVIIGGNGSWLTTDTNTTGVAFVGTFDLTSTNEAYPAFVFSSNVGGTGDARLRGIASTISHEAGHTLGLTHDGSLAHGTTPAQDYYFGHTTPGTKKVSG